MVDLANFSCFFLACSGRGRKGGEGEKEGEEWATRREEWEGEEGYGEEGRGNRMEGEGGRNNFSNTLA